MTKHFSNNISYYLYDLVKNISINIDLFIKKCHIIEKDISITSIAYFDNTKTNC